MISIEHLNLWIEQGVRVETVCEPGMSWLYREARSTARGRHLVAAAPLHPGDVILSQEPYAWVLYDDQLASMCDWTCRPSEALSRCSSCKLARCVNQCTPKSKLSVVSDGFYLLNLCYYLSSHHVH